MTGMCTAVGVQLTTTGIFSTVSVFAVYTNIAKEVLKQPQHEDLASRFQSSLSHGNR